MDTFEQKIRLIALEDRGEDTAIVKVSDLVELLDAKEEWKRCALSFEKDSNYYEKRYEKLVINSLQAKPCSCSKYLDLRG